MYIVNVTFIDCTMFAVTCIHCTVCSAMVIIDYKPIIIMHRISNNNLSLLCSGGIELVAKGSLLSVDPDRIITKRAVISGYPLKINKKSCVVRYMFFNRGKV